MTDKHSLQSSPIPQLKNLRQFYSPNHQLFQDAVKLPQFFMTNLVDDSRVVKCFHNDPQANIRIFYYQYLKLCFQIDNVEYQSYIQKIYELIRTEGFQFYFNPNDNQKQLKNAQYKSILIDFFQLMSSATLSIDTVLNQYPILDEVFTNFFRTVVMLASVTNQFNSYINKNDLFDFLSSFFSVDISSYDKCLKFVQSDIFVYEQSPQNIYMAFIKDQEQQPQQSYQVIDSGNNFSNNYSEEAIDNTHSKHNLQTHQEEAAQEVKINIVEQNNSNKVNNQPSSNKVENSLRPQVRTVIKQSYIEGQFSDYTSHGNIQSFGKNVPCSQQVQIQNSKQILNGYSQKGPQFTKNFPLTSEVNYSSDINLSSYINLQKDQRFKLNQNDGQNNNLKSTQNVSTSIQHPFEHENRQIQNQQLKRVLSGSNIKITLTDENKNIHTDKSQNQKQRNFVKGNSQPNLLSQKNHSRMVESFYEHGDSGINIQKTDHSQSQQSKTSNHEKKNIPYMNFQQPTKDPGFGSQLNFQSKNVHSTIYHQLNQINQLENQQTNINATVNLNRYQTNINTNAQKNNTTTSLINNNTQRNNTTTSLINKQVKQPLFHRPQFVVPTLLSKNSLSQNGRFVSSSPSQKQTFSPLLNSNIKNQQKQDFKLNVTKQFTNSFVMKMMKQPYQSTVYQTRQRARQFRKNIYQQLGTPSITTSNLGNALQKPNSNYSNISSQSQIKNQYYQNQLKKINKDLPHLNNIQTTKNQVKTVRPQQNITNTYPKPISSNNQRNINPNQYNNQNKNVTDQFKINLGHYSTNTFTHQSNTKNTASPQLNTINKHVYQNNDQRHINLKNATNIDNLQQDNNNNQSHHLTQPQIQIKRAPINEYPFSNTGFIQLNQISQNIGNSYQQGIKPYNFEVEQEQRRNQLSTNYKSQSAFNKQMPQQRAYYKSPEGYGRKNIQVIGNRQIPVYIPYNQRHQ